MQWYGLVLPVDVSSGAQGLIAPIARRQLPYTGCVEAHRIEATVGKHGNLVLENLPFEPGQPVEVLVLSKAAPSEGGQSKTLRGSVLEYHHPFDPVANEEWEALR